MVLSQLLELQEFETAGLKLKAIRAMMSGRVKLRTIRLRSAIRYGFYARERSQASLRAVARA